MYNRYIPQSDGSFQRSRMPDQVPPPYMPRRNSAPAADPPSQQPVVPPVCDAVPRRPAPQPRPRPVRQPQPSREVNSNAGVLSFLRQLLPRDFDTSDLMIVLLFLLMSGDCGEDQNSALLTLALYLFM